MPAGAATRGALYRHRRIQERQRLARTPDRRRTAEIGGGQPAAPASREADFVARLGGDEFAIVQTGVKSPADVTELVDRIFEAIRAPYECLGHQLTTDASHRHCAGAAGRHRSRPDPEERRPGDVCRQGRRPAHLSLLRARHGRRGPRPPHPGDRPAPGDHRRRLRGLLPALRQPAGRPDHRLRGAAALAPSASAA